MWYTCIQLSIHVCISTYHVQRPSAIVDRELWEKYKCKRRVIDIEVSFTPGQISAVCHAIFLLHVIQSIIFALIIISGLCFFLLTQKSRTASITPTHQ